MTEAVEQGTGLTIVLIGTDESKKDMLLAQDGVQAVVLLSPSDLTQHPKKAANAGAIILDKDLAPAEVTARIPGLRENAPQVPVTYLAGAHAEGAGAVIGAGVSSVYPESGFGQQVSNIVIHLQEQQAAGRQSSGDGASLWEEIAKNEREVPAWAHSGR